MADIPPLWNLPGFLVTTVLGTLFRGQRRAPPLKDQLRVFNANNPQPQAPTREQDTRDRRTAATRALESVRRTLELWNQLPQAPWLLRKKYGKNTGRLYTLQDAQRNILNRNKAITDAQQKAAARASRQGSQAETAQRATYRRGFTRPDTRGRFRASPFGIGSLGFAANYLGQALYDRAARRLDEQWQRRIDARRAGGLGGAASRAIRARKSVSNRTGAGATRPFRPGSAGAAGAGVRSPAKSGTQPTHAPAGAVGPLEAPTSGTESAGSRTARDVMSGTRAQLPTATTTRTATNPLLQGLLNIPVAAGMSQLLGSAASSARAGARTRTRTQAGPGTSSRPPTPGEALRELAGKYLTPLNATGVAFASEHAHCSCPKPKKQQEKAKKEFHCSNPLVSRSVTKDGVITIKRKLLCQPFRTNKP